MKKLFLILGFCIFAFLPGRSQDDIGVGNQGEKIKALEIAYITKATKP